MGENTELKPDVGQQEQAAEQAQEQAQEQPQLPPPEQQAAPEKTVPEIDYQAALQAEIKKQIERVRREHAAALQAAEELRKTEVGEVQKTAEKYRKFALDRVRERLAAAPKFVQDKVQITDDSDPLDVQQQIEKISAIYEEARAAVVAESTAQKTAAEQRPRLPTLSDPVRGRF